MAETKAQRLAYSCGHAIVDVYTKVGFFVVKKQTYHNGRIIEDQTRVADSLLTKLTLTVGLSAVQDNKFFWEAKDPEAVPEAYGDPIHLVLINGNIVLINSAKRKDWPESAMEFKTFSDAKTASLIIKGL